MLDSLCIRGKEFFDNNHLHGNARSTIYFGLLNKSTKELLSAISLRKPFHKTHDGSLEISRFVTAKNTTVIGGFGKLFNQVKKHAKENGYKSIISYADLLTGNGLVYEKAGFERIKQTGLNYWYTDGSKFYNRFKFRATKEKPQKEVAKEAGVYKIFGAGNYLYKFDLCSKQQRKNNA